MRVQFGSRVRAFGGCVCFTATPTVQMYGAAILLRKTTSSCQKIEAFNSLARSLPSSLTLILLVSAFNLLQTPIHSTWPER